MKMILPCILLLSLICPVLAKDPDELVKLREAWEDSLSEIKRSTQERFKYKTQEANKLYYEELQEMKSNFMKAENLQAAVAVNKEIEKLKAVHGKQEFEPPKVAENKPSETQKMDKRKAILEEMVGNYEAHPLPSDPNDWHFGKITVEQRGKYGCPTVLRWTNKAKRSWLLFPDLEEGLLRTSQDNPYYNDERVPDHQKQKTRNWELWYEGGSIKGFKNPSKSIKVP